jgi:hypothetical protein
LAMKICVTGGCAEPDRVKARCELRDSPWRCLSAKHRFLG